MGVEEPLLRRQLEEYNEVAAAAAAAAAASPGRAGTAVRDGAASAAVTDAFGKRFFPSAFDVSGPFWLGQITPVVHYCMGGLEINEHAQVRARRWRWWGCARGMQASTQAAGVPPCILAPYMVHSRFALCVCVCICVRSTTLVAHTLTLE